MSGDDLAALGADLASSPERVMREVRQVVSKGSLNIKNQLKAEASGSRSFGQISRAMGYEITETGNSVESEIGPDSSRDSSAGLLMAYYGQSRGGGGTLPDPIGALEAEEAGFIAALERLDGVILE
ncbi:hypothetical protein AOC05_04955 [Arthrobacter alpinus]|uniref:Phage protein, HK97 gp10 family n=1 Tax=Arthrobacter alpinus TaxID=656366 RepID=A0A0M4QLN6_9MICC|nr:hypothetical protein [Arthrobacter alpinus]ALE91822.1 hypothetical protein AOC05_04955 [Arthrobacter alpinus]